VVVEVSLELRNPDLRRRSVSEILREGGDNQCIEDA
jgi:hypothetical protein